MKYYKVYATSQRDYEAVKQGWSWPALFFSFIWAMVKKMWKPGFSFMAIFIALGFYSGFKGENSNNDNLINIFSYASSIIFALKGNQWRENNLSSRGYEYIGMVKARNHKEAINFYINKHSTC